MARNLGEAFVQISPDLSGFGPELQAGVQAAMSKAVGEVESANQEIEASFRETANVAEQALGQVDGDGFQKVRQSADAAGEAVEANLREGARAADQALSEVDGDQFREAKDEAKKAGRQIGDSLEDGAKQGDRALSNLAKSAGFAALAAGLTKFAKDSIDAFADLGETVSKATVIFGENVDQIVRYGDEASQALGQSKQAAIAAASDFAIFGNAAGLSGAELASFSTSLTTLASDLASFSNTTPEDAVLALGAALRGESEPIRRYGVLLNEATLQQRAVEMGIRDTLGPLTQQERVLAANAEIFAQTTLAQGDFARTSDSLANQQKILAAEFKDLQVTIGQALAPAFSGLISIAGSALEAFGALPGSVQTFIAVGAIGVGAFAAMSNAIQNLGVAAKTANVYLAGIAAAVTLGIGIYTVFTREAKEAQERQDALNTALVEANDPATMLVSSVQELVTQYQALNPATEEATDGLETLAGAEAFVQAQLLSTNQLLAEYGVTVADVTNSVRTGTDAFEEVANAVLRLNDLQQSTTSNIFQINRALEQTGMLGTPVGDALLKIAESGDLTKREFALLIQGLDETADAFDDQVEANNDAAQAFLSTGANAAVLSSILGEDVFNSILETSLATAEAAGRSDSYTYALENLNSAANEATAAEQARWDEMDQAARAAEDVARAQETYNTELEAAEERLENARDALYEVIDAQNALMDATLESINSDIAYRNQIDRTIEAIQDYQQTEDDLSTTIDEKAAAMRDAEDAVLRQATRAVEAAIANGTLTEAQRAAGGEAALFADELRTVAGLLDPNDPLRANLLAYAESLEKDIPDEVRTEIIAEVEGARQDLSGLKTEATAAGLDTGRNFADGVAEGIRRQTFIIQNRIETLIEETRFAAQRAAEIRSPSELFAREVGAPIVDGIIVGIDGQSYVAVQRMDTLATDLTGIAIAAIDDMNLTIEEMVDRAEQAFEETVSLVEGRRDQVAEARRVKEAEDRVAKAQAELNKVLADGTSTTEEITVAQKRLADSQIALQDLNYRLLESNYDLIEQGPAGVASFESLARAAGLEASEISILVTKYQELIRLRKEAAEQEKIQEGISGGEQQLKLREQLDRAIQGLQTAFGELDAAARKGQNTAAREVQIANAIVEASKLFAQVEGASPGTTDFFRKQLDALLFFAGGRTNILDDLAQIISGLQRGVQGFANGGIFSSPTFGVFGEAGPEAIIPISRPGRALELMSQSGLLGLAQSAGAGGPAVQIQNATFASATDADLVAQRVTAAYLARTPIG